MEQQKPEKAGVSEQPSPGACVLLEMLGGGGGGSAKKIERGSALLCVTTCLSVPSPTKGEK